MANIIGNIQQFRSMIDAENGLARIARFGVRILPGSSSSLVSANGFLFSKSTILNDLIFLCESAEFPGRALNTVDYRYGGPGFKYPSQTVYSDMTLSFIVRNTMKEKLFFDDWMEAINPISTYEFNYKSDYSATIQIYSVGDYNTGTDDDPTTNNYYSVQLLKAYPINVNPMAVNWADENFHRLQVQFAFSEWENLRPDPSPSFKLVPTGTIINNTV